jgi:ribosomal-protein-alanine N-acetyltransferase
LLILDLEKRKFSNIMYIPTDTELTLITDRLILEPTKETHAEEMILLFQDPNLFKYIPQEPQKDLEKLRSIYRKRESKVSPQKDQLWLNWIGRNKETKQIVGEFQATVYLEKIAAEIAYSIDIAHQGQHYAYEAMSVINKFLFNSFSIQSITAYIDTRNEASIKLVEKLGMQKVNFIKDADEFKGSKSDEYVFEITKI